MTSRIDIIGSNGNDGDHYLVEDVSSKILDYEYGDDQVRDIAMRIIALVRKHDAIEKE